MITIHIEGGDTFLAEAYWVDKTEKYLWFRASFNPKDKYSRDRQRHSPSCRIPYQGEVNVNPIEGCVLIRVTIDEERL